MKLEAMAVVLGPTGQLGPAVCRALLGLGWRVRAASRRPPRPFEATDAELVLLDGSTSLAAALAGASVVVDLVPRGPREALELGKALGPGVEHLVSVVCGVVAGKTAGAAVLDRMFPGRFHALLLPRVVAEADADERERVYLDAALSHGSALVAGGGEALLDLLDARDAASVIAGVVRRPPAARGPHVVVGGPPVRLGDWVRALLSGAGAAAGLARAPAADERLPHGAGSELLDRSSLPLLGVERPIDPLTTARQHGAWLAARRPREGRERRLLPIASSSYQGRRVIDIHGRTAEPLAGGWLAELASWLSPAFYLDVGRPCNSQCLYCAVPPHADTQGFAPLARLVAQIDPGIEAGCDKAILIGGEPTLYPELLPLLGALSSRGLSRNILMTNGLMLSERGFADQLRASGVATFHVSVDTADPEIYRRLSRSSGRHERQLEGLASALASGAQTYVYTAVTRVNAAGMGALIELVARAADAAGREGRVLLAFVKPLGDALVHAGALWMPPDERIAALRAAVARGDELGVRVATRNLQPCLAPDLLHLNVDLWLEDYSLDLGTMQKTTYAHRAEYACYPEGCGGCAHRSRCGGVYRAELPWLDASRFQAIR